MYLSFNWLKDFVKIPGKITPKELGEKLTLHTVEIDGIAKQADKLEKIVVGKILEIKKHPNADKLQLVSVEVGKNNGGILDIVCGAKNIKKGNKIPVALIGAILPNGLEIKKTKIRGEESSGMLCSQKELNLGSDNLGIMILGRFASIGQDLSKNLDLDDIVFEVDNKSITNRPDLWGHYGLAREIGAFLGVEVKQYKTEIKKPKKLKRNIKLDINIKEKNLCPRYMAVAIEGIKIEDSPKWIQKRLLAVGVRPINNIVDITNYVMLETGQPLHAFDLKKISSSTEEVEIIVRLAKKGEEIKTLDDTVRKLDNEMLVITDSQNPIAIAGVMGGHSSEVDKKTTAIIIESANFEAISTRKTSQKLGLRTEASKRYEKNLDPNLCETALARTIELIKKTCKKSYPISEVSDESNFNLDQNPIELNLDWLEKIIGYKIEDKKIIEILDNLGFEINKNEEETQNNILQVTPPTWRSTGDISIVEDLVEEITRIYGYDNLTPVMPIIKMSVPVVNKEKIFEDKIKNILAKTAKLTEVYNYSFVNEEQLEKICIDYSNYIKLENPITNQHTMLRQSLSPNVLQNIKLNQSKYNTIEIFELGYIYLNLPGYMPKDDTKKEMLPFQEKRLCIGLAGDDSKKLFSKLKGIVQLIIPEVEFNISETAHTWTHEKMLANVFSNDQQIGILASIDKKILRNLGIKKQVVAVELDFYKIFNLAQGKEVKFQKFAKYPPVIRDLCFVIDEKILYNDIKIEIEGFDSLIREIKLIDEYSGNKLEKDKKSLTFNIVYQSAHKTLKAEEIDELQKRLINTMQKKFNAQVRE